MKSVLYKIFDWYDEQEPEWRFVVLTLFICIPVALSIYSNIPVIIATIVVWYRFEHITK